MITDNTNSETPFDYRFATQGDKFDYRFATQGDNAPVMLSSGAQRNANRSIGRGYEESDFGDTLRLPLRYSG
ncbi:MAG TPA: hypothetical protein PLZ52_10985 [Bacteroidales bacterium]|nr:hypothetical protein [Bacteroidales bacterium]